jgi:uncharacterized membrane protein
MESKKNKKTEKKKDEKGTILKKSLFKSIIYRMITLVLGTLTSYLFTGDIGVATGLALLTEAVQSVNYFIFESIWSYYERKRLRKKIEEEIIREIDLTVNYEFLRELSYELSRFDTFVEEIYRSIINFYDRLLKNEQLEDIHDEIKKHREIFVKAHEGRNFKEIPLEEFYEEEE